MRVTIVLWLLMLALCGSALLAAERGTDTPRGAPTPSPSTPRAADFFAQAAAQSRQSGGDTGAVEAALAACSVAHDIECNSAITLYDRKWKELFAERSFEWHLLSTKLLFGLVMGIVLFGLYITYVQFTRDYQSWSPTPHHAVGSAPTGEHHPTEAQSEAAAAVPRPASSIKIGAGSLELSSQVIGLIVLAMSFAFFYLYVKTIYPMVEARAEQQLTAPSVTAQ